MNTGNPVFDFRARHRIWSNRLQWSLILGGAVLAAGAGLFYLCTAATIPHHELLGRLSLCGLFVLILGVAWGVRWRQELRRSFREEYGPKTIYLARPEMRQ